MKKLYDLCSAIMYINIDYRLNMSQFNGEDKKRNIPTRYNNIPSQ